MPEPRAHELGWFVHSPDRGYHMIGSALRWVSDDRIVMGLDLAFDDWALPSTTSGT